MKAKLEMAGVGGFRKIYGITRGIEVTDNELFLIDKVGCTRL